LPICSVGHDHRGYDICGLISEKLQESAAVGQYLFSYQSDVDDVVFLTCQLVDVALHNLKSNLGIVLTVLHDDMGEARLDQLELHVLVLLNLLGSHVLCTHRFLLLNEIEDSDGYVPQSVAGVLYTVDEGLLPQDAAAQLEVLFVVIISTPLSLKLFPVTDHLVDR
jgi:hypothetical protein